MADLVGAVDQGTTSTRFMLFDHGGNEVGRHQLEHEQILPRAGWVEHSPVEIWERTRSVIQTTMIKLGWPPRIWPLWASPTSARRRWSGIGRPTARTTTPSSCGTPTLDPDASGHRSHQGAVDPPVGRSGVPWPLQQSQRPWVHPGSMSVPVHQERFRLPSRR